MFYIKLPDQLKYWGTLESDHLYVSQTGDPTPDCLSLILFTLNYKGHNHQKCYNAPMQHNIASLWAWTAYLQSLQATQEQRPILNLGMTQLCTRGKLCHCSRAEVIGHVANSYLKLLSLKTLIYIAFIVSTHLLSQFVSATFSSDRMIGTNCCHVLEEGARVIQERAEDTNHI